MRPLERMRSVVGAVLQSLEAALPESSWQLEFEIWHLPNAFGSLLKKTDKKYASTQESVKKRLLNMCLAGQNQLLAQTARPKLNRKETMAERLRNPDILVLDSEAEVGKIGTINERGEKLSTISVLSCGTYLDLSRIVDAVYAIWFHIISNVLFHVQILNFLGSCLPINQQGPFHGVAKISSAC